MPESAAETSISTLETKNMGAIMMGNLRENVSVSHVLGMGILL
jgi:hypothetical protein